MFRAGVIFTSFNLKPKTIVIKAPQSYKFCQFSRNIPLLHINLLSQQTSLNNRLKLKATCSLTKELNILSRQIKRTYTSNRDASGKYEASQISPNPHLEADRQKTVSDGDLLTNNSKASIVEAKADDATKVLASSAGNENEDDPSQLRKVGNSAKAGNKIKGATSKVLPIKRKRERFNHANKSVDRNFITAIRAMNEYLLKPNDLEGLRKTHRRSPYENAPPITVYLRKDVETKAMEVWGSKEALAREIKKRQDQDRQYREHIFQVKLTVKEYRQSEGKRDEAQLKTSILHGSGRVVLTAIAINASNCTLKTLAWMYTGSHSLFAEAIHSLADTCNQLILAYGVHKSIQAADSDHPYGYSNMRYVASLISGVGIFCFGTGISMYHGIIGLLYPQEVSSLYWAFFILGGSLISEGATLIVAMNAIRRGSKQAGMSIREYVIRAQDPLVNVVLLEDTAAVIGVTIAACCMGLSIFLNSTLPDAVGSIMIGGLLGFVALFIISTNSAALVGRSIPIQKLNAINRELENDVMIRAIHDAKCIDMGNGIVRYKAEIDFDGRELTRSYLDKQDLDMLLEELQKFTTIDEVEGFMLKHGENVIDLVGAEIDRIECHLKKNHPEVRHCDLEIL